jgi:hypothetical protein
MSRVAIELSGTSLRALRGGRFQGAASVAEGAWNPEAPLAGVTALQKAVGPADVLVLVLAMDLLHVARVDLPPAPHEARERMLALEPERFFLSDEPLVVALAPESDVAFAVPRRLLDSWLAAFSAWAQVVRVEPSPVAVGRALGSEASGTFMLDAITGARTTMTVRDGRLVLVRSGAEQFMEQEGAPPATRAGVPSEQLAVRGGLEAEDAIQDGTLWSPAHRRGVQRLALRASLTAALAVVAAVILAGTGYDRWRDRTLVALSAEAERLASEAAPAIQSQQRLAALVEEAVVLRDVASRRADPGAALAAIGRALPDDAVLTQATSTDSEWRIDGTVRSAATLVPRLDAAGPFQNVRSLAASTRFLDGQRARETFSVAFRVNPSR